MWSVEILVRPGERDAGGWEQGPPLRVSRFGACAVVLASDCTVSGLNADEAEEEYRRWMTRAQAEVRTMLLSMKTVSSEPASSRSGDDVLDA